MRNLMGWIALAASAVGVPAVAAAPVIDNARVTVWDVTLAKGEPGPATPHDLDTVIMFLEGGRIRTVSPGRPAKIAVRRFGDAVFLPKGADAVDSLLSDRPAREIIIALKDHAEPPVANTTGLPAAFPRPGSVNALSNDRVAVWRYSWKPGARTPTHFHERDVVIGYRYDGVLKSVTPEGVATVNTYKTGEIRFNKANRAHYEVLTSPRESAVVMELK